MRSDRLEALEELRRTAKDRIREVMGLHHTMGYSGPIWPESAARIAEKGRQEHERMVEDLDDVYAVGHDVMCQQQESFSDMLSEVHKEWLETSWLHKPSGKDIIVLVAAFIASHLEGKIYRAQLPKYIFYLNYNILIEEGFSLTDLVWHANEPRNGSIVISSMQLDMMNDAFEARLTISSPSMRSSYLTTKEKSKKLAKELDVLVGMPISERLRMLTDNVTDEAVFNSLPVLLWRKGYRPEGNRLLLEKCMLWDDKGRFSSVLTAKPEEYFTLPGEVSKTEKLRQ